MNEPRRKAGRTTPPAESAADEGSGDRVSDRPTVNPPFDVEAFARASAAAPGLAHRLLPGDRPTARPPALDVGGAAPPDPPPDLPPMRAESITLTNELELETARVKSIPRTDPPRSATPSFLSMVNARLPSHSSIPAARHPTPPSNIEAAVLGAIGSAAPEITERTIDDPIAEMRDRFALGDYSGALEMAELLLAEDASDADAAECAARCRAKLEGMYAARLGALDRVPSVIVQRTQLRWLSIDHRAGFILSLIDGSSSLDVILDLCGMPRLDALRILQELVQQRIVALK